MGLPENGETMNKILAKIMEWEKAAGDELLNIRIYSDGSGRVESRGKTLFDFRSIKEFLEREAKP